MPLERRGLGAIRTAANARGSGSRPSQVCARMLTLELERERQVLQCEKARNLLKAAEVRLSRIDAELTTLRELAEAQRDIPRSGPHPAPGTPMVEVRRVDPVRPSESVKHRY